MAPQPQMRSEDRAAGEHRDASESGGGYAAGGDRRRSFTVPCAGCGGLAHVPFKPWGRPVYCGDCYPQQERKGTAHADEQNRWGRGAYARRGHY